MLQVIEDHWTDDYSKDKFLGVCVRYFSDNKLNTRLLELKEMNDSTAKATKCNTNFVIDKFGLTDKKLIYVTDNCPSMKKAFDNSEWYGCFLHIISLVQKHAFSSTKLSIINVLLTPQFVNLVSKEEDVIKELRNRINEKAIVCEDETVSVPTKIIDSFFDLIPTKKRKVNKKEEIEYFMDLEFSEEELIMDPIIFWSDNKSKFPVISEIAIDLLTVPASSIFVESLFSKAGWTRNERRNLDPKTLNSLLFCNSNSYLLN